MVHRAADSRLLSNLLQQEKEYSKQLNQVLDSSNASLASFAAYAAASPPPASQVIMAVTTSLAAADEALRRYVRGVEEWRESMRILKDAEEEVGNIMRDREILVTRMIKASKSHKSGSSNFRESLLLGHQRFPSSSSLSLSFNANQDSPSPPPSRPLSGAFSSTKLAAAQSELQACEAHLAAKERELDVKRCAAVRDGMGARVKAMMECGWAWNQYGKEALRALEDIKIESPEHRQPGYIPDTHPDDVFQTLKIPALESTQLSSDFSSIGPSQSASQVNVNHEHLPPPVHMGSIMNSGLFGDPPRRFDNTEDNSQANDDSALHHAQVQDHQSMLLRPSSGLSTTTSSMSAIPVPATYKVETMTYAQPVALHVAGRDALASFSATAVPPPIPASPSQLLTSSELFKEEDVHRSMRIPAPHALEGYAFDIPTAEITPLAGPSGVQHDHHQRSRSNTPPVSGRSTPQPIVTGPSPLGASVPPVASTSSPYTKRRVLERRITEEELRKSMEVEENETRSVASSTEEDAKTEKKLVQEGKLAVVENPRFMTEARKRELEREERMRAAARAAERQRRQQAEAGEETETKKEKKRFSFFHSHSHSHGQSPQVPPTPTAPAEQHVTFDPAITKGADGSPSKGFFGNIKGFFVTKHSGSPSSSPAKSKKNRRPIIVSGAAVDSSDEDEEISPTARSSGGLQGLFRGYSASKDKVNLRDRESPRISSSSKNKWETRTDKNIRQLTKRASLDEGSLSQMAGSQSGGVAGNVGFAAGPVGSAIMNAGYGSASELGFGSATNGVSARGRTVSDVGVGSTSAVVAPRRLKKNRAGPPVSGTGSALGVAGRRVVSSTESFPIDSGVGADRVGTQRLPTRAASTSIPTKDKGKVASRRSASVDVSNARRRTWGNIDAEDEGGSSSGGGMIVDLGKRRKATSDIGGGLRSGGIVVDDGMVVVPPPAIRAAEVNVPQDVARAKVGKKGYSSDTAAVAPAPASRTVVRRKSLTKKRTDTMTAAAATSPTSASTSNLPARKASVKSTTSGAKVASSSALGLGSGVGPGGATFLSANNDNPTGTLVAQPGWNSNILGTTGGAALTRNLSVTSSSSAPPISVGRGKKKTSLGQGIDSGSGVGIGRRSSVGGSPTTSKFESRAGLAAGGAIAQPAPPPASLMSIVEDVARQNRVGWSPESDLRKSLGGSQKVVGMMEVVRAPPPLPREALQTMVQFEPPRRRGAVMGGGVTTMTTAMPAATAATTTTNVQQKMPAKPVMFEVKAPGSVFDQRPQMGVDTSLFGGSVQTSTPKKEQVQAHAQATASVRTATLNALEGRPQTQIAQAKTPLRSAMRNPSPGPSRPIGTATQQLPPPTLLNGHLTREDHTTTRNQDKGKGKAVEVDDGGTTTDSESYETGTEYYSGEEDNVEKAPPVSLPPTKTAPVANGHATGYETPKKSSSEVSHSTVSTTSTLQVGSSSQNKSTTPTPVQRHPSLVTHTPGDLQTPRRRKSVRVSLQPTFSPSPPAIDYDYEEEQARYAPWNGMEVPRAHAPASGRTVIQGEVSTAYNRPLAPLPASVPERVAAVKPSAGGDVNDMWQDSGSDEDEEYARAKRLLSRAAKREKNISVLVANRAN